MYRLFLLALLVLGSCAPAYVSNSRQTPLFGEAGEFAGAVVLASGVDAQVAASVTDNIGLMAAGSWNFKKHTDPEYSTDHSFYEAGLGYFGRSRAARYEVYAGYGIGQGNSYDSYYFFQNAAQAVVTHGKYQRIFVQPALSTNYKKFNLILAGRLSMVNFTDVSTTDSSVDPSRQNFQPTEGFHFVFEPSLTTRFPLAGNLYGFFQLNINAPIPNDAVFGHEPLTAAIGIQLHTGKLRTNVYR